MDEVKSMFEYLKEDRCQTGMLEGSVFNYNGTGTVMISYHPDEKCFLVQKNGKPKKCKKISDIKKYLSCKFGQIESGLDSLEFKEDMTTKEILKAEMLMKNTTILTKWAFNLCISTKFDNMSIVRHIEPMEVEVSRSAYSTSDYFNVYRVKSMDGASYRTYQVLQLGEKPETCLDFFDTEEACKEAYKTKLINMVTKIDIDKETIITKINNESEKMRNTLIESYAYLNEAMKIS